MLLWEPTPGLCRTRVSVFRGFYDPEAGQVGVKPLVSVKYTRRVINRKCECPGQIRVPVRIKMGLPALDHGCFGHAVYREFQAINRDRVGSS